MTFHAWDGFCELLGELLFEAVARVAERRQTAFNRL